MPVCCHAHPHWRMIPPPLSRVTRRTLWLRCDPEDWPYTNWCSSSGDNPALTCMPLSQERIANVSYSISWYIDIADYPGPTVTCRLYCTTGNAGPWIGDSQTCTACGAGKYSVAGSGATVCTDCDAGKFQATAEASTCSGFLCAVGKYSQPGATSSAAAACTDCREGTYSEKEGSTVCASCKAGKYSTAVGATACSDCGAGKSSASSSTVCADCGTGTYSDVSGSTACLECTKKPCPFGTFELSNCTRQADKVCQVYVHNVPTIGKIVIACGQVPFVVLTCFVVVFKISKLRSAVGVGANGKWAVFSLFVIGIYDVVSDFTTLALIPLRNPFYLFQLSLTSLNWVFRHSKSCLVIQLEYQTAPANTSFHFH